MTIKAFLINLRKSVSGFKKNQIIGDSGFYFKGINNTDGFGSPGGGSWKPAEFNSFEFSNDDETYLIRLIEKHHKIVVESSKQKIMILNYELNQDNCLIKNNSKLEIKENYIMTVRHAIKRETVKSVLSKVGMNSQFIYNGDINDSMAIMESIILWTGKRSEAKKLIRAGLTDELELEEVSIKSAKNEQLHPINTILYGPPGTGKTFSTIDIALEILGQEFNVSREKRKVRFAEYQKEQKIFFTTFHQNMAYEDFIEGIKPVKPEEDDEFLKYDIEDGLFMRACVEATFNLLTNKSTANSEGIRSYLDFNALFDLLYDQVVGKGTMELSTKSDVKVIASTTAQGNFSIRHVGKEKPYTVSRERLAVLFEKFPDLSLISNITNEFRNAIGGCNSTAYWSVLNRLKEIEKSQKKTANKNAQIYKSTDSNLSYEQKKAIVKKYWSLRDTQVINDKNYEPFVFIIDEINRGNVSQIFGELITLIEEDKRIGRSEVLYIDLPYSKQPFAVPPNLFIIGTMNTADRSVEALDTALRRRFSFIPKMPEESKLGITTDGIDLSKLLYTINNRLRILKDSDHTIGHAWLWNVTNLESLKIVFRDKILPLLQEYFYNDYEKLGLVLGDAFFKPHVQLAANIFAKFSGGNGLASQYEDGWQYELKSVDDLSIEDFKSLE
jgi:SpoVK/Ycf46/Vps4 family AAA+-type ATPase